MRTAVTGLVWVCLGGALISGSQEPAPALGTTDAHVMQFLDADDVPLVSYRAVRYLEAAARNGRMKATLTAATSLDPARGFQYDIVEETGSGVIRSKVLRAALEAERRAWNADDRQRAALNRANYDFGPEERLDSGLVRIAIRPRRSDSMVVEGTILVTDDRADLIAVEGRLVKRPSFWTRRVDVIRRYSRIAGVRVPVSMESTADVLLAGRCTFSMQYEYEAINDGPLPTPAPVAARSSGTGARH